MTDVVHGHGWNTADRFGGWQWRKPSHGEHFRTCSFCGSIHPEDLAAEQPGTGTCRICGNAGWDACFDGQRPRINLSAEERAALPDGDQAWLEAGSPSHRYDPGGWWASWADRKYGYPHKFYVDVANRDPATLYVTSSTSHPTEGYIPYADLNADQRAVLKRDGHDREGDDFAQKCSYQFGTHERHHAKFYTMHLADPEIPDETKETIAQVSGLRFRFLDDGRIGWEPTHAPSPA